MAGRIHRVILFKVPDPEQQKLIVDRYKKVFAEATKDGKPSILSLVAGTALPDERSQGITVVVKAEFASLDDMNYFDNDCPVNTAFKDWAKTLKHETKPISVYFEPTVVLG